MGVKEDVEKILSDFEYRIPEKVDRMLEQRLKNFQPQNPCKGDDCPARQTAKKVEELSGEISKLNETIKVKIPNPSGEKIIDMEEALRIGLDDVIEKGKSSKYYEIVNKRKRLIPEEGEGGVKEKDDKGAKFRKSWL